jgi:two-component system OmpR family sensor kinase
VSLRVRLLLAVGAVAVVALVVADIATYSSLKSFLYDRVDQSLESAHFRYEGPGLGPGRGGVGDTYVEVRSNEGEVQPLTAGIRRGAQRENEYTPKLPDTISGFTSRGFAEPVKFFTVRAVQRGGPRFRVRASQFSNGQLVIAQPLDEVSGTLRRLLGIEVLVTLGALVTAAGVGWWLVRVGLHPLGDVEATAVAIADGDMDRRVPGDDAPTEVGRLARALNTMLARIQEAFAVRDATEARLRRFVADASHELRTPVAAVGAYAELFDRGASTRPEDLQRVMTGIRSETQRMGELVQDLLLLARLDEGRPLDRKPVELVALAAEAVETASAVGPAWPVRLDAAGPAEIAGDRTRLRQVLDNLLGNVRAHTPPGTDAVVRITSDGAWVEVSVVDHGPGLSGEQRDRVFERFYRVDPSRSRQQGGSGLGLAIVAAIVEAHGGTVSVAAPPEGGAAFTVRLPQSAPDADDDGGGADGAEDGGGADGAEDADGDDGTTTPRSDAIRT